MIRLKSFLEIFFLLAISTYEQKVFLFECQYMYIKSSSVIWDILWIPINAQKPNIIYKKIFLCYNFPFANNKPKLSADYLHILRRSEIFIMSHYV